MTPQEFERHIAQQKQALMQFINQDAPIIAAKVAVDAFTQNFQDEAFFGEKWEEVNRRKATYTSGGKVRRSNTERASFRRPILTGDSGDLGRSIEVDTASIGTGSITVEVNADKIRTSYISEDTKQPVHRSRWYGKFHNEGTPTIPKRQFMGEHPDLTKATKDEIERKLRNILPL